MSTSIRKKAVFCMSALVLVLSVLFTSLFYTSKQEVILQGIDKKLLTAATMAHALLPENYHNEISSRDSVDALRFRQIVRKFDQLSLKLDLQYLWSVLVLGRDEIYFTSATSTQKKTAPNDHAHFFGRHSNPEAFHAALDQNTATFSFFENKWGQGRMVLIPMTDSLGRTYMMGASVSMDSIDAILADTLIASGLVSFILMVVGISIALLFSQSLVRPLEKLQSFALKIKQGDFDVAPPQKSYREINQLSQSMVDMGQAISEKVSRLLLSGKVFDNAAEAIVITDSNIRIIDVNPAFSRITGYSREEAIGHNPNLMNSGVHRASFYENLWADLNQKGQWSGEIWDRRKSGEIFPKKLSISSVVGDDGSVQNYVGVFSDISDVKAAEDKLIHQTLHDNMTGLPNRILYRDRLMQAIAQARRNDTKLAIFFLDVDHFKVINDAHGHWMGDSILKQIAKRLKSCLRESDTIARMGADEFAIIMNNPQQTSNVEELARLMNEAIETPLKIKDLDILLSASIGISIYPQDGQDHDSLTNNADAAMFECKKENRGGYRFFTSLTERRIRSKHSIEIELRSALQNKEFELYYQPKIDIRTHELTGVEALIRWNNKKKGLVSPDQFIPLAEETGLILPIGHWVIETACRQLKEWRANGFRNLTMAINLSPVQFQNQRIINVIDSILSSVGLPAEALEIEITEGVMVNDSEELAIDFKRAKQLGLSLSVDDFGTGYCSLAYLKRYPVDCLKIDRAFIKDITQDREDDAIVSAILSMAKVLNIKVVAEGVETQEQLNLLKLKGCQEVQGYFFSKPLPAKACEKFFKEFTHAKAERSEPLPPVRQPAVQA